MGRVRLALAAGLIALATALGILLSRAPLTVAGTNDVPANFAVTFIHGKQHACENGGTVPAGTTAIRVSLSVNVGPEVNLRVLSGSQLVTEGEHNAGWGVDETVTVPVRRVRRTTPNTRVCAAVGAAVEPTQVNGLVVRTPSGALQVLLRMEYLRPGPSSWASLTSSIARDMGFAHAPGGAWVAYATIAAMLAVATIISRTLLRELT